MRTVVDQHQDIGEILLTEGQIQQRVTELGAAISNDLALDGVSGRCSARKGC